MRFLSTAKEDFGVQPIESDQFGSWVNECAEIYRGNPCWLSSDDHIDTVNFAKSVCSEVARLATMDIKIKFDGSARAKWIQDQMGKVCRQLRHWIEYGCAYGTVILKPNGDNVALYTPASFAVTDTQDGEIRGAVFYNGAVSPDSQKYYARLEYHRFVDDAYVITNRCYIGYSKGQMSRPIDISLTPWSELAEEVRILNLEKPLFGVFRTPQANNIDIDSPMGLPIFSEAVQELRDLDIAYSRNSKEIRDSKRTVLLDSDAMLPVGSNTQITAYTMELQRAQVNLPDMVKNVQGNGQETYYQEINPTLNTDTRLTGINALLSQIGYKVGFSNGYFVFNESTGIQTATQVEADQQRTVQLIQDVREKLLDCIKGLVYALSKFADLYSTAPVDVNFGNYAAVSESVTEAVHLADIVYSFEDDKQHHYNLAVQGKFPWEEYYVRYLKCSREEARNLLKMAKAEQKAPTLFGMEEE